MSNRSIFDDHFNYTPVDRQYSGPVSSIAGGILRAATFVPIEFYYLIRNMVRGRVSDTDEDFSEENRR